MVSWSSSGSKYGGEDLPFDDLPDRAPVTRLEFAETRKVYSVCACQPSGRVWGFRFFATENQRTLVRGRARQDRAASRRHRTAAIFRTPRAAPLGALGPRAGRADPRRPHRTGPQPARVTAACPSTLAPDTNRRAMSIAASQFLRVPAPRRPLFCGRTKSGGCTRGDSAGFAAEWCQRHKCTSSLPIRCGRHSRVARRE